HGDRERGEGQLARSEKPQYSPETRAAAVFVERFHVDVAYAHERLRAGNVGDEALGCGIAVQNRVFRALLDVQYELERDTCGVRPFRIGRMGAIADHVARIACGLHANLSYEVR